MKVEQEVPNEFLLLINDGDDEEEDAFGASSSKPKPKGAFYKNIERKMQLKKRRLNVSPWLLSSLGIH